MLWWKNQTETFSETINDNISALNVTTVLGMNEPQELGQSNLTAAEGAQMSRNIGLCSPAPSGAPGSTEWLTNFLFEFLVNYHEVFKLNIWVTEWACQNMQSPQNQCSMSDRLVEQYAWYGAKTAADMHASESSLFRALICIQKNAMMDTDGVINDLGRQYIGLL
ncbi:hypothetical protein B0H14DRAFT_3080717 [Mycena olivaceomarginata]|nr:hypothetical protein B0H14DRAFT_3080717 [Mycena olivaceomarginata]